MRYVAVPGGAPASGADLPDTNLMGSARDLGRRFPKAGLRPCALVRLTALDEAAGGRVWLALELLQVTGSFKVRGALLALGRLLSSGAEEVIAASAGNHGAGVAYAARVLGMHATVVVPRTAPEAKRSRIAAQGATLHLSQAGGYDEAEREATALARERGVPFVSPYDDVAVVAGNGASLGYDIADALGHPPSVVLAPFGGGGLATGLACALPESRVYGAQSEASSAFALSLERGAAVESLPAAETLADGLEGGISPRAFERARRVVRGVLVMSEREIGRAMATMHRKLGVTTEGSAAVALAPLLDAAGLPDDVRPATADGPRSDVVVVLTGRNVDDSRLCQVLRDHDGSL